MRKYFLILLFPSIVAWGNTEISAPFFWGPYEKGAIKFEKASILLAVKGEEERYVQLDTGSGSSYVYGESEKKSFGLVSRDERDFIHTFNPKPEISAGKIIGTLGAGWRPLGSWRPKRVAGMTFVDSVEVQKYQESLAFMCVWHHPGR